MDLTKMFVLVPVTSTATVADIKTKSGSDNKIYFMAKYNQIVAKGVAYGIDPVTAKEIQTTITALGGTAAEDGTVTVDFSGTNYASTATTAVAAIKALDTKIKGEMDKIAASKTLNDSYEVTAYIGYTAGTSEVGAYIGFHDEEGKVLSKVNVSDIIGNGVLDHSTYDEKTGILTLYFKTSKEGVFDKVEINLTELIDIGDIAIGDGSKNYLKVTITTTYHLISDPSQTITQAEYNALSDEQKALYTAERGFALDTKMVKVADATTSYTGLVDAKDVKDYVDGKSTSLSVEAAGDDYVSAYVDAANNKKVWVAADVQNVTYSAGVRGTWTVSDDGTSAELSGETAPSISGVAQSLVDGAQVAEAIKTYSDAKVAAEAAERDAKIKAAKNALNTRIDNLGGDVTSDDSAVASVEVTTYRGEVSDVIVTTLSAGVNRAGDAKDARIITYTSATGALVGADIAYIKGYVDDKVADASSDLGVSASGNSYVSAYVSSENNKHVNVAGIPGALTVTQTTGADSVISGSADKFIAGAEIAAKVASYVNARIDEEIKKLDVAYTDISSGNAHLAYSETDGIVKIEGLSLDYATTTVTAGTGGADTTFATTDDGKLVKGSDVQKAADFANTRIAEEIAKLDVTAYTLYTNKDKEGDIHFTYSEADGVVKVESLEAVYSEYTAYTGGAGTLTAGIVTGTELKNVFGDVWETYAG